MRQGNLPSTMELLIACTANKRLRRKVALGRHGPLDKAIVAPCMYVLATGGSVRLNIHTTIEAKHHRGTL